MVFWDFGYGGGISHNCIRDSYKKYAVNKKIGESKMDNKEELKRSSAEEEQRAKDILANVEKMKKQLEELDKKEEQPTVSATGCFLKQLDYGKKYFYINHTNVVSDFMFTQNSDKERFNINNCFSTRGQAEQEALRREGQEFIRRCAMLWNKSNDWRKKNGIEQYYIYFDLSVNKIDIGFSALTTKGHICFDTYELVEKCIKELNEKYNNEQLKTIFGVI